VCLTGSGSQQSTLRDILVPRALSFQPNNTRAFEREQSLKLEN
jgi:hypothetical protein